MAYWQTATATEATGGGSAGSSNTTATVAYTGKMKNGAPHVDYDFDRMRAEREVNAE